MEIIRYQYSHSTLHHSIPHCHTGPSMENCRPMLKKIHLLQFLNWRGVGLELGLEDTVLRTIEHNHPQDPNRARREILSTWLDQDNSDATYGKLVKTLVAVGEAQCAQQLAEKIGERFVSLQF